MECGWRGRGCSEQESRVRRLRKSRRTALQEHRGPVRGCPSPPRGADRVTVSSPAGGPTGVLGPRGIESPFCEGQRGLNTWPRGPRGGEGTCRATEEGVMWRAQPDGH